MSDQPNVPRRQMVPECGEMKLVPFPESDSHPPSDYSKRTREMVDGMYVRVNNLDLDVCELKTRVSVNADSAYKGHVYHAKLITNLQRTLWVAMGLAVVALAVAGYVAAKLGLFS